VTILACEGFDDPKPAFATQNMIDYANAGGRIFASHYSYVWIYRAQAPFSSAASWNVDQPMADPATASVDTTFPKGRAFGDWLVAAGASDPWGQITIAEGRNDSYAVGAGAQRWIYTDDPNASIQHFTFNTPMGTPAEKQCGKVVYSDFHVSAGATDPLPNQMIYPARCTDGPLTEQEKAIEFMLFDLSSCIQKEDEPTPMPATR
jgi:hypothetical protein